MSTARATLRMRPHRLSDLERGILWPVVYASIFRAPVRASRLLGQVVGVRTSEDEMRRALSASPLRDFLVERDGLVWLRQPDASSMERDFRRRERATRELLDRHREVLDFLRGLPSVRLAALSGGCAHDAAEDGDIDVFAVTEAHELWSTLFVSTLVAKAKGWRRVLCLNYLVDVTAQALPARDFYAAFELISLRALKGEQALVELLDANSWAKEIFPNFLPSAVHGQNPPHTPTRVPGRRLLEAAARMIHRPYLRHRLPESPGVELSDHVIRLHANDHRARIRGHFQDALHNIGVEAPSWI